MDAPPPARPSAATSLLDRLSTLATIEMSLAAVVSTWCAYQSAVWGGIQTIRFNEAAAARVESSRSAILGTQQLQVDLATFIAWVDALQAELGGDLAAPRGPYRPDPSRTSGFLFNRFRREFRPAALAWLATRPLQTPEAPPTPFAMEEYPRALNQAAVDLSSRAEQKAREAFDANRTSNLYMLTTVLAALIVFFSGTSAMIQRRRNGIALLLMASALLVVCTVVLVRLPVSLG